MACEILFICTQDEGNKCKYLSDGYGACPHKNYCDNRVYCEYVPSMLQALNEERGRIK